MNSKQSMEVQEDSQKQRLQMRQVSFTKLTLKYYILGGLDISIILNMSNVLFSQNAVERFQKEILVLGRNTFNFI